MVHVAVSILNHNSAQSTTACVQSLLDATDDTYALDIYVADNASADDDQRQLQDSLAEYSNVHVQNNARNLGFAAGHNRNIELVFQHSKPDFVWLLNSDCLVYAETLSSLLECSIDNPAVGIWGTTLLEPDGETVQCAGGCFYNSWISSYKQYGQGKVLTEIDKLETVGYDYIAGASLFFPVKTLKQGLWSVPALLDKKSTDAKQWLNESLFLYFEELDLAQRLKPGFGMAWCKKALVKHSGGASTGTVENQRTALAEYHSTLSALKFTRLYYPRRLWVMAPVRYFSKCLLLILRRDFRLIGSLSKAYRDFWTGSD